MIATADSPAALLAALDRGEALPARWYTDPAITEREIALIFRKSWNYIGPLAELAEPGDYVTGQAGDVPIVVVRNDGGLAAFVNVCRHRRHIVMKGRGNAKIMRCAYHAWAYDLGGVLKAAPKLLEPIMRVEVVTPEDYMGDVIGDLNSRRGQVTGMDSRGNARVINAMVPLANMFGYVNTLRSMSQGRAQYTMHFDHYEQVPANEAAKVQAKYA